jgi:hypothetical protein
MDALQRESAVTGPETYAAYRRMTPAERLALTFQAIRESTPYLLSGPAEVVERRFARLRDENDARNRNLLERLARAGSTNEER